MEETATTSTPWHLWLVTLFGFLWYCMGTMDLVMTLSHNDDYMKSYSAAQIDYFYNLPLWVNIAWAIAVFNGVMGSVLLVLTNAFAIKTFLVSIVGIVITSLHNFVLTNGLEIMGSARALTITAMIYLVAIALYFYARLAQQKGWII